MVAAGSAWPPLEFEDREWIPDPSTRGPRADRMLGRYRSAIAPEIAGAAVPLTAGTEALCRHVERMAADLQLRPTADLSALTGALLRSESVASSKIERLSASQADVALVAFGASATTTSARAAETARAVAANMAAMSRAVARGEPGEPISIDDLLAVHHELLQDDPIEHRDAGRIRIVQNWIGGSDYSPRGALFVPPDPRRVHEALVDLVSFCNRPDLPPVAQAAIAHAQFETIHPFADGNGRSGRALVHLLWRRTGLAPTAVVPVSTALLADIDAYFAGLGSYRDGDVDAWVAQFADAAIRAADAATALADAIDALHSQWREDMGQPRRDSAATALLRGILTNPVLDIEAAARLAPVGRSSLYRALDDLVSTGVLAEVTGYRRNRVWFAPALFGLLERFELSVGHRRRPSVSDLLQ